MGLEGSTCTALPRIFLSSAFIFLAEFCSAAASCSLDEGRTNIARHVDIPILVLNPRFLIYTGFYDIIPILLLNPHFSSYTASCDLKHICQIHVLGHIEFGR